MIVSLLTFAACGTKRAGPKAADTSTNVSATVTTPTTTTTTTPTTSVTTTASPNGLSGDFNVADNFVTSAALTTESTLPSTAPDKGGAFRFMCLAGQLLKDDPLMLPGQPGKSHLHQFFGNTGTNASSNYNSLRTSGGTTCGDSATPVQRSAYWIPAMLDGAGNAVKPDWMNTYYKRLPANNPACGAPDASHVGYCTDLPNGLRFIFGYNMTTGKGGPTDTSSPDQWVMGFACADREGGASAGAAGTATRPTIAAVVAAGCPANAWLRVWANIPDCWDGKNLDSADHRSHMAYADGPYIAAADHRACPADHPYLIAEISGQWFFTTDANFVAGKWHLSSDEMMPGTVAGTTMHMDYWEAWSPTIKAAWEKNCINGHLSCSSGELGDGTMIKGMGHPSGSWPSHVLVPLSTIN
jgi:hypothetical protein